MPHKLGRAIHLNSVAQLHGIARQGGGLRIDAMTRFLDLVSAPELRRTNAEAVLRDLREAEGKLLRVTLSPPCSQMSVD